MDAFVVKGTRLTALKTDTAQGVGTVGYLLSKPVSLSKKASCSMRCCQSFCAWILRRLPKAITG